MDLSQRFAQLDAWLAAHQTLWRSRPFIEHRLEWEAQYLELARFLRGRTLAEAEASHNAPERLDAPAPFPKLAAVARALSAVPDWSQTPQPAAELLSRHVPGRKWEQINCFAEVSLTRLAPGARCWLDWCAGKGHLGRLLAVRSNAPALCLEHDPALNEQGRALSQVAGASAEHRDADVLSPTSWALLEPQHTPVALHACGQLHMTLLVQASARRCAQLVISPCCYNRIGSPLYEPMSRRAQAAQLQLSRDDLGLPLQETVTAGSRVRRLRDQSMAWRLAFDHWQREVRGTDTYLPTPSRPESAMNAGIAAFCRSLAEHHGLTLTEPASWTRLEEAGWARLAQVRNLELVPALFRRPLELWLLLDRALFLQEQAYEVQLGEFCPRHLTPRNLMLIAHLADS